MQPLLEPRLGIGLDRINRAFWLANAAVDALVWLDDEHILTFVEAMCWTHLDAVHVFTLDAVIVDNIGHGFSVEP
jgi:hypothetical protein